MPMLSCGEPARYDHGDGGEPWTGPLRRRA